MWGCSCGQPRLLLLLALVITACCARPALGEDKLSAPRRQLLQTVTPTPADLYPWEQLLGESYLFYEAQQSGYLPSWNRVLKTKGPQGWRANSHTKDGRGPDTPNVDLSGGFYEAGNHLKCGLQFGHSMSVLALSMLVNENAYRTAGEWDNAARNLKWAAQWLVKAHLVSSPDPSKNNLVVQVGDGGTENPGWWRPEQEPEMGKKGTAGYRPAWTTLQWSAAADQLGEAAGAMATIAMVLNKAGAWQDKALASNLIGRARNLTAAAMARPGSWQPPKGDNTYPSSSYLDDVAWGAVAVCWYDMSSRPSKLPSSCSTALKMWGQAYNQLGWGNSWNWDQNIMAAALGMANIQALGSSSLKGSFSQAVGQAQQHVSNYFQQWLDKSRKCGPNTPDYQLCYTPGGLAFLSQWGPLRYMGLSACAATSAATSMPGVSLSTQRSYRCWARQQLGYALGNNPLKQSYVVGYQRTSDTKAANRPHHRSSSCDRDFTKFCNNTQRYMSAPNPNVLHGALLGGPSNNDSFVNKRSNYVQNEVALDYNAGYTCALSGLALTTSNLRARGCTWDKYCQGGCDQAAADPDCASRSSLPAYTKACCAATNTTKGFGITARRCSACGAAVPASKVSSCTACSVPGISSDMSAQCLACVLKLAARGADQQCASLCTKPSSSPSGDDTGRCVSCLDKAPAAARSQCGACMDGAAALAKKVKVGLSDKNVTAARTTCLGCVQLPYATDGMCSRCLSLATVAKANACLTCLKTSSSSNSRSKCLTQ